MIVAVIPAFNEEKSIQAVARETAKHVDYVIVIDDGSTDSTVREAKKAGAIVLRNLVNLGKGNALRTGVKKALSLNPKIIVLIDADGQHEPKEIPCFVEELRKGFDAVIGTRRFDKNMPKTKLLGNRIISNSLKLLFGVSVQDSQCGFRAFKATAYPKIAWISGGYSMDSEIAVNLGRNKLKFKEIPISTIYSDKFKGTSVLDGAKIMAHLLWWKLVGK